MSPKQIKFYRSLWSQLCNEFNWKTSDNARRYALHEACGCPHSSKDWNQRSHFDRFKSHALALLAGRRTGGTKIVDEAGEKKRIIWRIETDLKRAGLPEAYVQTIITDQSGLACWREFDLVTLRHLRMTIRNRARRKINPDAPRRRKSVVKNRAPQAPRTPRAKPMQPAGIDCPF